jgi:hypothetical protein
MTNHLLISETWLWIEISAPVSGIKVAGVMAKSQALGNTGGEYVHFMENGIDMRLDGSPYSMHHKVIIIDGQIVVTGSYNFSKSVKLATMKIPWLYTAR